MLVVRLLPYLMLGILVVVVAAIVIVILIKRFAGENRRQRQEKFDDTLAEKHFREKLIKAIEKELSKAKRRDETLTPEEIIEFIREYTPPKDGEVF